MAERASTTYRPLEEATLRLVLHEDEGPSVGSYDGFATLQNIIYRTPSKLIHIRNFE